MDIFQKHPSCLKTPEAAKIIRNFNQLATVLVEFEILYHNGWLKQVEVAKTGTIASRVRVNFSPAYRGLSRQEKSQRKDRHLPASDLFCIKHVVAFP